MDELNLSNEEIIIDPEDTSSGNEAITHPFNPNEIEIETPPFTASYSIDRTAHA